MLSLPVVENEEDAAANGGSFNAFSLTSLEYFLSLTNCVLPASSAGVSFLTCSCSFFRILAVLSSNLIGFRGGTTRGGGMSCPLMTAWKLPHN